MEFQLNEPKVREMAARLRSAFGKPEVPQGKALEVLAQTFGFKNWDTLSGMLKKETASSTSVPQAKSSSSGALVLAEPFVLYAEAFSCDEFGESPSWVRWTVDQAFVDKVLELQHLCESKCLDHLAVDFGTAEWGGQDSGGNDFNIRGDELQLSKRSFWLRAMPKHAEYYVESRGIDIEDFIKAIQDPTFRSPYLAWADGVLFQDGSSAQQFARQLLDDKIIDINESRIDKMPSN